MTNNDNGERKSVVEEIWMAMDSQENLRHLQEISKEPTNCTMITKEGERTEVKLFLPFSLGFLKNMISGAILSIGSCQPLPCLFALPSIRHLFNHLQYHLLHFLMFRFFIQLVSVLYISLKQALPPPPSQSPPAPPPFSPPSSPPWLVARLSGRRNGSWHLSLVSVSHPTKLRRNQSFLEKIELKISNMKQKQKTKPFSIPEQSWCPECGREEKG